MFFEALQSYCAPVLTLAIFIAIILKDTLFEKRTKNLFLCETLVILTIILATWADRCFSVTDMWQLRTTTTFINFAFSPISPLLLMMIYSNRPVKKLLPLFLPMIGNVLLCVTSLWNGCVFYVTVQNEYSRGVLFFFPYLVSGFYLIGMIVQSAKKEQKRVNRREETVLLVVIMIAITVAALLEIVFVRRFMLWSTTEITVMLYFMVLSRQKIKYDDLTGTYSRAAYSKRIDKLHREQKYVIAMIDIDGLKVINDTLGHACGDVAISRIADGILKEAGRNMQLYRIGGDEFVLIAMKSTEQAVDTVLNNANLRCGTVEDVMLTFSFGIASHTDLASFEAVRNLADERLYRQKSERKVRKATQAEIS